MRAAHMIKPKIIILQERDLKTKGCIAIFHAHINRKSSIGPRVFSVSACAEHP